jgi:hypothetical protein
MDLNLRQIGLACALVAVCGVAFALGWWQDNADPLAPPIRAAETPPNPPLPAASDLAAYEAILAKRPPFGVSADPARAGTVAGGPGAPGAAGPTTPHEIPWRVGGIITTELSRSLVILIGKPGDKTAKTELKHSGDSLPDGSIVGRIESGSVTLDRNGDPVTIKMFLRN